MQKCISGEACLIDRNDTSKKVVLLYALQSYSSGTKYTKMFFWLTMRNRQKLGKHVLCYVLELSYSINS